MKRILISGLLLLPLMIAGGQNFEGGILGGLTASQIDGDAYRGYRKVGLHGGAWVRRMFTYTAGGHMEIRYVQKGALHTPTDNDPTYTRTMIHNIDIPLMAQLYYNEDVILELGVGPEILMSVKLEDENGPAPGFDPGAYHRFSMSAIAGVGYRFLDVMQVHFRFNYSILPIRPHPSGQTWLLNKGHYSNSLSIALYYEIGHQ